MLRMLKYHKIILLWFKDQAKYGKTIGNVCTPFWHMEETYGFSFALFFLYFSLLYFIIAQTTFVDQSMLTQSYNWNCNTHNLSKQNWWCTNITDNISKYMKLWKIIFHIAWFDIIRPYHVIMYDLLLVYSLLFCVFKVRLNCQIFQPRSRKELWIKKDDLCSLWHYFILKNIITVFFL